MPTRNVVLTEYQSELVTKLVATGRYQNGSEVLREGLRLVERLESEEVIRLNAMREAAEVGIADISAGQYRTFDTAETLENHLSAISDEVLSAPASKDDAGQ